MAAAVAAPPYVRDQTGDGQTWIECRFEGETLCLTQVLMAGLFRLPRRLLSVTSRVVWLIPSWAAPRGSWASDPAVAEDYRPSQQSTSE